MKENLYYLFLSGLILGSTSCLSFCAPILVAYVASHKANFKQSFLSYLTFSLSKLTSYIILAALAALGVSIIHHSIFEKYSYLIYLVLGCFTVGIGLTGLVSNQKNMSKLCQWLHKGNIRNMGVVGLLVGFSPCLPLLGILNYIIIIADSSFKAVMFSLVFGIGTVLSPLLLLTILSAKVAEFFSKNKALTLTIRVLSASVLIFLGVKIILQTLQR